MKIHFREEPRSQGTVLLTVGVSECSPLMQPFQLKVVTQPRLKFSVEQAPTDVILHPGDRAPTAFFIYTGLHAVEISAAIKDWVLQNLEPALKSKNWTRYLTEGRPAPKRTEKEK